MWGASSPTATPTMTPQPSSCRARRSRSGSSVLQRSHQGAQRFTSAGRPASTLASVTGRLSRSASGIAASRRRPSGAAAGEPSARKPAFPQPASTTASVTSDESAPPHRCHPTAPLTKSTCRLFARRSARRSSQSRSGSPVADRLVPARARRDGGGGERRRDRCRRCETRCPPDRTRCRRSRPPTAGDSARRGRASAAPAAARGRRPPCARRSPSCRRRSGSRA